MRVSQSCPESERSLEVGARVGAARGERYRDPLGKTRRNAPQPPMALGEVNPRGLEPWRRKNWANGRDWRDRGDWKLGKLERLGQLEDLILKDWEYGSPTT